MSFIEYRRQRSARSHDLARRQRRRRRSSRSDRGPRFVIEHNAARSDHYDLRLEIDGVLVSWAVPKESSANPQDARMARRTQDQDGDNPVAVWDQGTYDNRTAHEMVTCLGRGHLSFRLDGEKVHGCYALTRVRAGEDETWLMMKRRDDADTRRNPVQSEPASAVSGRTLDEMS